MAQLNGIDISHHNSTDVAKVSADFVIVKATEGVTYTDPRFAVNIAAAKKAGKLIGAYHYMRGNSPTAEAKHFLAVAKAYIGEAILVLDYEDKSAPGVTGAKEFLDYIKKATGVAPVIYLSRSWENTRDLSAIAKAGYPAWIAQYNNYNTVYSYAPRPLLGSLKHFGKMAMFQYTSTGKLPNGGGNLDLDVFYGNRSDWQKLAGGKSTEAGKTAAKKPVAKPKKPSGSAKVKSVQTWLNSTYGAGLTVDGFDGPKTDRALLKAYQRELNKQTGSHLSLDGLWGAKTQKASIVVKQGARGNITRIVQGALICKGYDPDGFDGVYGSGCRAAVAKFQRAHGLSADGIFGPRTAAKLF
ncbi:GH25 family lysozyme [Lacticaseibacillus hulanensis]|uniref:GH25 family lysozyme n=1 Tax=Lacticaseibacillus hulanensis TaxID=2493111 RepID=UPI000FDCCC85|nr:GH25 family lysozyme [Lacticaseibacillus hulanensis]